MPKLGARAYFGFRHATTRLFDVTSHSATPLAYSGDDAFRSAVRTRRVQEGIMKACGDESPVRTNQTNNIVRCALQKLKNKSSTDKARCTRNEMNRLQVSPC